MREVSEGRRRRHDVGRGDGGMASPWSYRRTTEVEERRTRDRPILGPTGKRFALDEPEIRSLVIKRVLEKIGRERPILLWLDDLHHAPPSTADALAKIRRDSANLRLMIIASARDEALVADPAIERWVESLRHAFGGPRMNILPLDRSDTHTLLRMSLPVDDFTIQEAESRSNGNPLFALQILHAWAARAIWSFPAASIVSSRTPCNGGRRRPVTCGMNACRHSIRTTGLSPKRRPRWVPSFGPMSFAR